MSTKSRLDKAERVHKQTKRGERRSLFVYYAGQDFGKLDGVEVPLADFQATRRAGDVALKVVYHSRSRQELAL